MLLFKSSIWIVTERKSRNKHVDLNACGADPERCQSEFMGGKRWKSIRVRGSIHYVILCTTTVSRVRLQYKGQTGVTPVILLFTSMPTSTHQCKDPDLPSIFPGLPAVLSVVQYQNVVASLQWSGPMPVIRVCVGIGAKESC